MARPREFDQAEVAQAIRRQFVATGFASTSISHLTMATGLGKGSLYGAFGDKEQMFRRTFDAYCEEVFDDILEQLDGPDETALARLSAYADIIVTDSSAEKNPHGCFLAKTTAELAAIDPEIAQRALDTFRALDEQIAESIVQAQRAGDIDATADPRSLALLFLAAMRGIESMGKSGMTREELQSIATAAIGALTGARGPRLNLSDRVKKRRRL
ncbi:TetR/AcrR family transcriptional regulator [soil metagenome]